MYDNMRGSSLGTEISTVQQEDMSRRVWIYVCMYVESSSRSVVLNFDQESCVAAMPVLEEKVGSSGLLLPTPRGFSTSSS